MAKPPRLLVIAGSDSSGGAGLQADLKTACAFGVYAMTAVTAVTAQDTTGVHSIHPVPASFVCEQIACCLSDIGADAIKIGMLGTGDIAEAVADVLEREARGVPLVLDPVLVSSSGTHLLDERGIAVLRDRLIPIASLVMPNIPEAEMLAGMNCSDTAGILEAGKRLVAMGAGAALIKGGHAERDILVDTLVVADSEATFSHPRQNTRHTHGTGCTYATAIAVGLAEAMPLTGAISRASSYLQNAILTAPGFGHGQGPLNHLFAP